jgi:cobyrinic acid a,c-diamide synthase
MIRFMITAPSSNTGKTSVTCGLLSLLAKKGLDLCSFKCGPDYIDPMFHRSVLGVDCCNLDVFLGGRDTVRKLYRKYTAGKGAAVVEGVMGFYDGISADSTDGSAYDVAETLDIPAILVLRPKGAALTLAAVIKGMAGFREPSRIKGVILNDCSEMFFKTYAPKIEKETGIPMLGYLPHMEEAVFSSRHLGLYTAGEIEDLSARIGRIADKMDETIDFDRLAEICEDHEEHAPADDAGEHARRFEGVRVAVANDEAFCFIYRETLDTLREMGAETVFFSPVHDSALPEGVSALYLPGGYPELYAGEISANVSMRESVRKAVGSGLPTVAECGGFLYLGKSLEDKDGKPYEMAGVLPGEGKKGTHLVRFGYAHLKPESDSMIMRKGDEIPEHEFHYWDSTENGTAMKAEKLSGRSWDCCFTSPSLFAGFPHLYMAGTPEIAERFLDAASKYGK